MCNKANWVCFTKANQRPRLRNIMDTWRYKEREVGRERERENNNTVLPAWHDFCRHNPWRTTNTPLLLDWVQVNRQWSWTFPKTLFPHLTRGSPTCASEHNCPARMTAGNRSVSPAWKVTVTERQAQTFRTQTHSVLRSVEMELWRRLVAYFWDTPSLHPHASSLTRRVDNLAACFISLTKCKLIAFVWQKMRAHCNTVVFTCRKYCMSAFKCMQYCNLYLSKILHVCIQVH